MFPKKILSIFFLLIAFLTSSSCKDYAKYVAPQKPDIQAQPIKMRTLLYINDDTDNIQYEHRTGLTFRKHVYRNIGAITNLVFEKAIEDAFGKPKKIYRKPSLDDIAKNNSYLVFEPSIERVSFSKISKKVIIRMNLVVYNRNGMSIYSASQNSEGFVKDLEYFTNPETRQFYEIPLIGSSNPTIVVNTESLAEMFAFSDAIVLGVTDLMNDFLASPEYRYYIIMRR